ncbi:hypothetical protein EXIGLDRAFT_734828 [Exidia glandulosa HHB12029]|uniref:Uncharacterized protein n=1 Tax=Exidia glandulosa HHB12029 TaxID=1314781 RepID=A0A165AZF5_EXIGL|nr:hypothetical protein EXIGLDRAFT_734828 [Exidia glandulosa HHB12029]
MSRSRSVSVWAVERCIDRTCRLLRTRTVAVVCVAFVRSVARVRTRASLAIESVVSPSVISGDVDAIGARRRNARVCPSRGTVPVARQPGQRTSAHA